MALTKKDFSGIKNLIEVTLDENRKFVTKDDIKYLPTKDEFYGKMDEVVGELKTIREEQAILSGITIKVNKSEERISKIERKLQMQPAI